ncbi:MAG: prolyl oligopeptidase family serine peptidase, partial [Acidobacteriota bacterium]
DILTPDAETIRTLRQSPSSFAWSPKADGTFAYLVSAGGAQQVRVGDARTGRERTILRGLEDFSNLRFATADTLIATATETPEADERGVKRFRDPMDRWTYRRNRSHLHLIGLDGSMQRLTASEPFDDLQDVHPDGTHLLIARSHYAAARRPFRRTELIELEIETLKTRSIADLGWFNSASYAPDGRHALVLGSAALFDGAGSVLAEDRIVNDYDAQAYLMDLESGDAEPLSRDFDPAIQEARWSGDRAFLRVEDQSWVRMVALDPQTQAYETVPSGVDVVHRFDADGGRLAWVGSSMNGPHAVWTSTGGEPQPLVHLSADRFADVRFGDVRDWSFTSKDGDEILGRVYLPPGVDESAAGDYPLIVYYYGGTAPVGRGFGGRYPKELWAAQGFVVYVLQPSGTTGFGQEFAARHVNAWGRQTADEILEGTKLFLEAHPFVDADRVGAIGASYGGFMTMYLQTRSDIFAAAVSHAGISNLASYWGQGWWGYLYSDAASAGSFPWNNKDLYVEQSPIYAADKITTPLLLLHGDADTNVPPVESHQMYTALEVLGK